MSADTREFNRINAERSLDRLDRLRENRERFAPLEIDSKTPETTAKHLTDESPIYHNPLRS